MIKIDYDNIPNGQVIPQDIIDKILSKYSYFDIDYVNCVIHKETFPFILADNFFDFAEANNDILEIGVKRTKQVSFTGGCMYIEYEKDGKDSIIVHGNDEEGYNIFIFD